MLRNIALIATLLLGSLALGAVQKRAAKPADVQMARTANAIADAKVVRAEFSALPAGGKRTKGTILIAGDRFKVESPEMSVWYDGSNQWTLVPRAREVDITAPTPEEIAAINPLAIAGALRKDYRADIVRRTSAQVTLRLTPIRPKTAHYKEIELTVSTKDNLPVRIVATPADGPKTDITVSAKVLTDTVAESAFRFDEARHPGIEVVDLR